MLIYTYADVVSPIDDIHIKEKHKYSEKSKDSTNRMIQRILIPRIIIDINGNGFQRGDLRRERV